MKMIKTAYELALNPTMPLKQFKVLVKCQRQNGVVLIEGRDGNKAAREYVHCIATAIREKCAAVIASQHFFSLLSDGSQARKTGTEKELVMIRVERNGIPCYFVVSLLEMSDYGGVDADSIKKGIDSIFDQETGAIQLEARSYTDKVVSATADGASVNTGIYRGVLTQLSESRPWLLTIHCANHRIELAFKAAMNKSSFKVCDDIYRTTYQLLKNSGKLNSEVQAACHALGINGHKKLPKIHGTRFINHRRKGMRIFMDMWPALITAFENAMSRRGGVAETKATISGLLSKLQSYEFFCKMAYYVDILDAAGPASLVFEGNGVMPYEISESIERTAVELDHLEASAGSDEELLDSNVASHKYDEETKTVHGIYVKEGHGRNKAQNRDNIEVEIQGMTYSSTGRANAAAAKKSTAIEVKRLLRQRFVETSSKLYEALQIYDPQYWSEESNYGVSELQHLVKRFEKPLAAAGLDDKVLMSEWRKFKGFARRQMTQFFGEPKSLWQKVLTYRRKEFPNLCLLIELVTCISGSNSAVERAFSTLTLLLSDRRLTMSHGTMEDLMLIRGNDKNWSAKERADLLCRAVEIYLEKRRKVRLDDGQEPKKQRVEKTSETVVEESSSEEDSESDSDSEDIDIV